MPAYKEPNKDKWFVAFYYTEWTGARKKKYKRGFDTEAEALEYEKDFLEGLRLNPTIKFGKVVDLYLTDMSQRVRATTYQTKQYVIRDKILPYFKDMNIKEIKPADIRRWQDDLMRRGYADTYLRTIHEQLSAIMNYAVKYYGLPKNPCIIAGTMGKGFASEMEIWTLAEFNKFMEAVREKPICSMAFMILFWTGCRYGEMLGLTVKDYDPVNKTLRINKSLQHIHGYDIFTEPKTPKSKRIISIPQLLADELDKHIGKMSDAGPDTRIIGLSRNLISREFKKGIKKSGVREIHIHCLRHSHTALIASLGATPVEAAERLGHENVSTTLNIYSHVLPGRQKAISDELDRLNNTFNISQKDSLMNDVTVEDEPEDNDDPEGIVGTDTTDVSDEE